MNGRTRVLRSLAAAVLAWGTALAMMRLAADPARYDAEARRYGMDWPGDLERLSLTAGVEVLVLWLLLRPWKPGSLAPRLLLAAALLAPYGGLRVISGMHAGPSAAAHDLWLIGVWIALLAAALLLAARSSTKHHGAHPASRGR
jgi:hypothetical protein